MQNEVLKWMLNRLSEIFPINESSLFLNTYIVEGLHLQHGFKSRNNIDITNQLVQVSDRSAHASGAEESKLCIFK